MSQFLAPVEEDPTHLFMPAVTKMGADKKFTDIDIAVSQQLKAKVDFDLLKLTEKGQLSLLQVSDKYGALFFAFGPELIVVPNSKLNQVLGDGQLNYASLMPQGSNKTTNKPIIFFHVDDRTDQLFLQHQGEDYLMIADLPAVLSDCKLALRDAKRVKLDLDGVDVRQVCTSPDLASPLAVVITRNGDNLHRLQLVNYQQASVVRAQREVTSAVFSACGKFLVAGKDSQEQNLLVLDLALKEVNSIKLSFEGLSDDIEVDQYRVFWVSEPFKGSYIIFAAYYMSQDDFDDNLGRTLMIWVGEDLAKPGLSLDQLKVGKRIKACFWGFDHQNDDLIPSFRVKWYENPKEQGLVHGFAMMNHCDQPFMFSLQDGALKEAYELTSKNQFIFRPVDPETDDVLDPQETLGACLGFDVLKTKMLGAPEKLNMTLIDDEGDEDLPYPQTMLYYSLDGVIKQYQLFTRQWRRDPLLKPAQPVGASQSRPALQAQPAQRPAGQEETKSVEKPTNSLFGQSEKPMGSLFAAAAGQSAGSQGVTGLSKPVAGGPLAQSSTLARNQAAPSKANSLFAKPLEQQPQKDAALAQPFSQKLNFGSLPEVQNNKQPLFVSKEKEQPKSPMQQQMQSLGLSSQKTMAQMSQKPGSSLFTPVKQQQSPLPTPVVQQQTQQPISQPNSQPLSFRPQTQSINMAPQRQPTQKPMPQEQMMQASQIEPQPKLEAESQVQKLAASMTSDMVTALEHANLFAGAYNEEVVRKMNSIAAQLPSNSLLASDVQLKEAGYLDLLQQYAKDAATKDAVKDHIEQTQRQQLFVNGQRRLCERLKREARCGVLGDPSLSESGPSSDLAKFAKTHREFLRDADYAQEDKEILLEVLESGNKAIENFDRVEAHLKMQEVLQSLHMFKLKAKLSEAEINRRKAAVSDNPFRQQAPAGPSGQISNLDRLRQNLRRNAGIERTETQTSRVSSQAYVTETTAFVQKQLAEAESNLQSIRARLSSADRKDQQSSKSTKVAAQKRLKFGDLDIEDEREEDSRATQESEMKQEAEMEFRREAQRKFMRDRKKQKRLQAQLIAQATKSIPIQLELGAVSKPIAEEQKLSQPRQAVRNFQQSTAKLGSQTKSRAEAEKEQKLIASFVNVDDRKREAQERDAFIATLDKTLISSPNISPRSSITVGKLPMGLDRQPESAVKESLKPLQSHMVSGSAQNEALPKRLDSNAKVQNSFAAHSFGSKTSDALQTQMSSKVAHQMSFGDEPKTLNSLQKKQLDLSRIAEKESPTKKLETKSKPLTTNPFSVSKTPSSTAPAGDGLFGSKGKPAVSINVNVPAPKPTEKKAEGNDLKSQKSATSLTDFKVDGAAIQGLFGKAAPKAETTEKSQPKPLSLGLAKPDQAKPKEASTSSLFGASMTKKEEPKSQTAPPGQNLLFGKPTPDTQKKEEPKGTVAPKPESKSLFGSSITPSKPSPALAPKAGGFFGQATKPLAAGQGEPNKTSVFGAASSGDKAPGASFASSFLNQAAKVNQGPSTFGQVDITAQKPAQSTTSAKPFGQGFGGFGNFSGPQGDNKAAAKPLTFSSASSSQASGLLKFGNSAPATGSSQPGGIQPLSFGQAPPAGGFGTFSQPQAHQPQAPAMQSQPLAFGQPAQPAFQGQPLSFSQPAQPGGFGGGGFGQAQAFQGFGAGGGQAAKPAMSAAMFKPRK